mmetsp:Transcript_36701/g.91996  ORF Transcript_36701/g.91996 Transcript_36701/m.91996 type:complete len:546 (-) Transcript_36701:1031-2668(-)
MSSFLSFWLPDGDVAGAPAADGSDELKATALKRLRRDPAPAPPVSTLSECTTRTFAPAMGPKSTGAKWTDSKLGLLCLRRTTSERVPLEVSDSRADGEGMAGGFMLWKRMPGNGEVDADATGTGGRSCVWHCTPGNGVASRPSFPSLSFPRPRLGDVCGEVEGDTVPPAAVSAEFARFNSAWRSSSRRRHASICTALCSTWSRNSSSCLNMSLPSGMVLASPAKEGVEDDALMAVAMLGSFDDDVSPATTRRGASLHRRGTVLPPPPPPPLLSALSATAPREGGGNDAMASMFQDPPSPGDLDSLDLSGDLCMPPSSVYSSALSMAPADATSSKMLRRVSAFCFTSDASSVSSCAISDFASRLRRSSDSDGRFFRKAMPLSRASPRATRSLWLPSLSFSRSFSISFSQRSRCSSGEPRCMSASVSVSNTWVLEGSSSCDSDAMQRSSCLCMVVIESTMSAYRDAMLIMRTGHTSVSGAGMSSTASNSCVRRVFVSSLLEAMKEFRESNMGSLSLKRVPLQMFCSTLAMNTQPRVTPSWMSASSLM